MNLISLENQDHIHIFALHHRLTHFFEICSDALWKQGAFFAVRNRKPRAHAPAGVGGWCPRVTVSFSSTRPPTRW